MCVLKKDDITNSECIAAYVSLYNDGRKYCVLWEPDETSPQGYKGDNYKKGKDKYGQINCYPMKR